jgi:hypothetical protein
MEHADEYDEALIAVLESHLIERSIQRAADPVLTTAEML